MNESLEKFDPHQVMEMLLFFGIPMKDTNELAHAVLDEFGSIYKAMEASFADRRKIPGITDNAATLICFCLLYTSFADLHDNMQLAWDMIQYIIRHVLENCKQELAFFNSFVDKGLLERLETCHLYTYRCV